MKRILFFFIFLIVALCIFSGCNSHSNKENNGYIPENKVALPECKTKDSKIIFNRFSQKMLSYNTKTFTVEQQSNIQNYMQYGFDTSNFYTAGNSTTNGFEILCVENNIIKRVYKLEDQKNQAIFPLATNGAQKIFLRTFYDNKGEEINRTIAEYNGNNKLTEFKNVKGLISYGVILSNKLYYTIFEETNGLYFLYSINLSDYSNIPLLINNNLITGELYAHNGKLYVSDKNTIYNENDVFKKSSLNYFLDGYDILIQIHTATTADLVLDVIDTKTKKILKSIMNVIDFSLENDEIVVYCHGQIDRIKIR